MLLQGYSYTARLGALAVGALLSAAWLYAARRLPPGAARLVVALPALAFDCAAPLLFRHLDSRDWSKPNELITAGMVEFTFIRLSAHKVLAWCCNRGPLVRRWAPLQFGAILLAPITPVEEDMPHAPHRMGRKSEHAGGAVVMVGAFAAKCALLGALLAAVNYLHLPQLVLECIYTLALYAVLGFAMDGPAAPISALLGVRVAPHFDAPWAASSLADFWAKRWDLVAGNQLRDVVYAPIIEGRLVHREDDAKERRRSTRAATAAAAAQHRRRRLLGMAACFLASGVLHEGQMWYMTGSTSRGLMMAFFLLQVPLLIGERWLGGLLKRAGWQAPAALRSAATLAALLLAAHWTWWEAFERYGVVYAAKDSLMQTARAALQLAAWPRA